MTKLEQIKDAILRGDKSAKAFEAIAAMFRVSPESVAWVYKTMKQNGEIPERK